MKYRLKCDLRAIDLWRLSMNKIYHSVAGVCNLVYTVALIFVTTKLWNHSGMVWNVLLVLLCSLFLVVQPVAIYFRAKRQVSKLPKEMEVGLDDHGVHIMTSEQVSHLKWKSVKQIRKENNMIIFYTNSASGLMIPNRVLGSRKNEIWNYVTNKRQALSF